MPLVPTDVFYTNRYEIFDVATQTVTPVDSGVEQVRFQ